MIDMQKLAANSVVAGFEYYDEQDFSFTTGGTFLPHFAGSYASYSNGITLAKNRLGKSVTPQILCSALVNVDDTMPGGQFMHLYGNSRTDRTIGSNNDFPVYYSKDIQLTSDNNNVNIRLTVGNPSGVNDVTPPTITVTGKVFLYLAPF